MSDEIDLGDCEFSYGKKFKAKIKGLKTAAEFVAEKGIDAGDLVYSSYISAPKTTVENAEEFDRLTKEGWALNLVTGAYEKRPSKTE